MITNSKCGSLGSDTIIDCILTKSGSRMLVETFLTLFCTTSIWSSGNSRGDVCPNNEQWMISFSTSYPASMDCRILSIRLATKVIKISASEILIAKSNLTSKVLTLFSKLATLNWSSLVVTLSCCMAIELPYATWDRFLMRFEFIDACACTLAIFFSIFLSLFSVLILSMIPYNPHINLNPVINTALAKKRGITLFGLSMTSVLLSTGSS